MRAESKSGQCELGAVQGTYHRLTGVSITFLELPPRVTLKADGETGQTRGDSEAREGFGSSGYKSKLW